MKLRAEKKPEPEQKKLEPLFFWNNYDVPKSGEPLSYGKTAQP